METGQSERDLVASARTGHAPAWHDLVVRERDGLLAYVRQHVGARLQRRVEAEDVVQDALLVAARNLSRFRCRGEGAFGAWLRRIADLRLREERRRHVGAEARAVSREISRGRRPDTAEFRSPAATPSQLAIGREAAEALLAARGRLSAAHQEVLRLIRDEGVSLAVAAERMQRSYGATKKLFARALAALEREIDGESGTA